MVILQERRYQREVLYKEVWEEPMIIVAKKYGVSDVALKKTCKKLNVPVPERGYWARIKAGQKLKKTPLPKHSGADEIVVNVHTNNIIKEQTMKSDLLAFLSEEQRNEIITYCNKLTVSAILERPHEMIKATIQHSKSRKESTRPPVNMLLNFKNSEGTQDRVFRSIDTLFKTLEKFGYTIENRTPNGERYRNYEPRIFDNVTFIKLDRDAVPIMIKERMRQVPHTPTKEEIADNLRYPSMYPLKDKELAYSGELLFTIDSYYAYRKNWNDSEKSKIENKIGEIVIHIMETIHKAKEGRITSEIAEKKRQEEERIVEILREKQKSELINVNELIRDSENYRYAQNIYRYIKALETEVDNGPEELRQYIQWAKGKADWINPIIRKDDELLGELDTDIREFLADENRFNLRRYW